ncbi:hypothetical protein [Tunicatimonas pelagia]|uniref:hypothetical protein n=1 Tax=Tunicatimonas pelagia TaxID=931531 RepID=UPI00266657A2|nr:hypothetical protein [Tunicatimonas pelagia]WKN45613.1 hypothetical protein P0M28_11660 [Tunicatimonas pelagia]
MNRTMIKKRIRFSLYTIALLSVFVLSCEDFDEDREGFTPPKPVLEFPEGASFSTQRDSVASIVIRYNVLSEITSLTASQSGTDLRTIPLEGLNSVEDTLTFNYTVPTEAAFGSLPIEFTVTDQDGRQQTETFVVDVIRGLREFSAETIATEVTLSADSIYRFASSVTIAEGGTLNIPPGSLILAAVDTANPVTIITEGGRLVAEGTAEAPIIFTSANTLTQTAAPGDWGGFILRGDEDDPSYSPFSLRYVRVEYAGGGEEESALFIREVSSTPMEYVQTYFSGNYGFYVREGTFAFKHCISTSDASTGFYLRTAAGNAQFLIIDSEVDHGDRDLHIRDGEPVTISNATFIGNGRDEGEDLDGARIRDDAGPFRFYNGIVAEYPDDGIRLQRYEEGQDIIAHTFIFQIGGMQDDGIGTEDPDVEEGPSPLRGAGLIFYNQREQFNNQIDIDSTLVSGIDSDSYVPDEIPTVSFDPSTLGEFFDTAPYAGAIGDTNWTAGWSLNADGEINE